MKKYIKLQVYMLLKVVKVEARYFYQEKTVLLKMLYIIIDNENFYNKTFITTFHIHTQFNIYQEIIIHMLCKI